jgi:cysteine dioxygenase
MSERSGESARIAPEALLGWRVPETPAEVPPPAELGQWLQASRIDWRLLDRLVRFEPSGYTRIQLARTDACELILACWLPGQCSRVHDHGGSFGAALVLRGELREARYLWTNARLEALSTQSATTGCVMLEQPETIHRIGNTSRWGAVTLHLYAPPMQRMTSYDSLLSHEEPAPPTPH